MELIIDNFAGGGGASTGIEEAMGRPIDVAINHDPEAIAMHMANHPHTRHYCQSIYSVDPLDVVKDNGAKPIGLAWFSPDCTHFSKAKGDTPLSKNIRDLAWVVVHWVERLKARDWHPRVIMLENVEEFVTWGPLTDDNKACKDRRGTEFQRWVKALTKNGYKVEWRILKAADYGAPTSRKRLYLIARRDGRPIVWPEPSHGGAVPYRCAADIIDWSIPCPSIFTRKTPLKDATMKRIAMGVDRYIMNGNAFIVPVTHTGDDSRVHGINEPLRTITTAKRGEFALVTAFMAQHNGGNVARPLTSPLSTITTRGTQQQLVTSNLIKLRNNGTALPVTEPIHTITAGGQHFAEVRAFLIKYYGDGGQSQGLTDPLHTITTRDRFGLVTVSIDGEEYAIADIGMRMLSAREFFDAQGFPHDYDIAVPHNGKPLTKTAQVRMCGNSVSPPVPRALVEHNLPELCHQERIAA